MVELSQLKKKQHPNLSSGKGCFDSVGKLVPTTGWGEAAFYLLAPNLSYLS